MFDLPSDATSIVLGWATLISGILGMGGQWLSARLDHPLMGIFSRWARWLLFTFGFAFVALEFEWVVAQRPLWIL